MIIRIHSNGGSFKGLSNYLTHDPDANTDQRVGWTHTRNLANDHVPSAVNEMVWTARDAELLKQEAGVRAGGRATENSVKHFSLNWSPEDNPSREHMIQSTDEFLRHMGWEEHQAVLIAHTDKQYAHVHVMLNSVHPETGLKLDDAFERKRAREWAAGYELQQGRIYCEQRLMNAAEREKSMPRNVWEMFRENQNEFERAEKSRHTSDLNSAGNDNSSKIANFSEWKILKEIQKEERLEFIA